MANKKSQNVIYHAVYKYDKEKAITDAKVPALNFHSYFKGYTLQEAYDEVEKFFKAFAKDIATKRNIVIPKPIKLETLRLQYKEADGHKFSKIDINTKTGEVFHDKIV